MPTRTLFTTVTCMDKPGEESAKKRQEFLAAHFAHVEKTVDTLLVAGPIFADDNKTIRGSFLIYKTDNVEDARAMLEADPYYKAGIWDDISFNVFYGAAGDAVGGIAYK